jgi:hypothetical protein
MRILAVLFRCVEYIDKTEIYVRIAVFYGGVAIRATSFYNKKFFYLITYTMVTQLDGLLQTFAIAKASFKHGLLIDSRSLETVCAASY